MSDQAFVITGGFLDTISAKTAHGLIRGTERFTINGVIDHKHVGKDAGEVLDGKKRNLPIFASIQDFISSGRKAKYCIVGVATKGGVIPDSLKAMLKEALEHGFSIVNGLHEYVSDNAELAELARQKGLEIIDVRKPKKIKDLHFWSGKITFPGGGDAQSRLQSGDDLYRSDRLDARCEIRICFRLYTQ
jgi:uncharacterized NAD-dependent epimerase/dehydratase family protein